MISQGMVMRDAEQAIMQTNIVIDAPYRQSVSFIAKSNSDKQGPSDELLSVGKSASDPLAKHVVAVAESVVGDGAKLR